jgi:LEA14-like dessication related protein
MKNSDKPRFVRCVYCLAMALLFIGCGSIKSNFITPEVSLVNLQLLPSEGFEQRFKVIMRITNPNASALKLAGMSYGLTLNGYKVVSGVANSIPEIPAYGENRVELEVAVNALTGLQFLSQLLGRPESDLLYGLHAELDTGLPLRPRLIVENSGQISLGGGIVK